MGQHRLDDFFKKKMDQRSVEFKEDHWHAMEQLLDDEPGKKRGFYFWVFGLLGLMCLTTGWFIYQNYNSINNTINAQEQLNTAPTTSDISPLQKETSNAINELNQAELNNNAATNNSNNNETDQVTNTVQSSTINNNQKGINADTPLAKTKLQKTKRNAGDDILQNTGNQLDVAPMQSSTITDIDTAIPAENTNTEGATTGTDSTPVVEEELSTAETQSTAAPEVLVALSELDNLAVFVEGEGERKSIDKCPYDKDPRFNFGLSAAVIQVPASNGNLQLWGTTVGGHVQFNLTKPGLISLNSGIAYTYLQGDFDYTQESPQIEYRFGKEQSAYRLMPRSLHFIEVPLTIKLQLARNAVEAGVNVSYLNGVRADVVLDGVFEDAGWIDKKGFNEIHTDLTLGYAWRMTQKWELTFRAHYALKNIIDETFEPVEGKAYDTVNPLQFRFGLKWNLR